MLGPGRASGRQAFCESESFSRVPVLNIRLKSGEGEQILMGRGQMLAHRSGRFLTSRGYWSRRSGLNRRPADYEGEEAKSKKTQEDTSDTKNRDLDDPTPPVDPPESS